MPFQVRMLRIAILRDMPIVLVLIASPCTCQLWYPHSQQWGFGSYDCASLIFIQRATMVLKINVYLFRYNGKDETHLMTLG